MKSETRIVENLGPARKYVIVAALILCCLAVLAAVASFVRQGVGGLPVPLGAIIAVVVLLVVFELTRRAQIKRKWLIRDEGLVLITKWRTETIPWKQIRNTKGYRHGLSIVWEPSDLQGNCSQEQESGAFLYLDKKQQDDLLAVIWERKS